MTSWLMTLSRADVDVLIVVVSTVLLLCSLGTISLLALCVRQSPRTSEPSI
jgi:hypothetical protein